MHLKSPGKNRLLLMELITLLIILHILALNEIISQVAIATKALNQSLMVQNAQRDSLFFLFTVEGFRITIL